MDSNSVNVQNVRHRMAAWTHHTVLIVVGEWLEL